MRKICLIGNYCKGKEVFDGQRLKVRLYYELLLKEGYDVDLIDLTLVRKRPFLTFARINKAFKDSDVIILMTAERGARFLIPYVNFVNRKFKKRLVFPLIGTSVLHYTIDKLSPEESFDFVLNGNYSLKKPSRRLIKNLSKMSIILPETDQITKVFREYYGLNNVQTLTNFRNDIELNNIKKPQTAIYLSRVAETKGIFDAIDVFGKNRNWSLDIYGPMYLSKNEEKSFYEKIAFFDNISYLGPIKQSDVVSTISKYSLFVFPTKYLNEGTPGVLIEALLAGTPILCSDFLQANQVLKNGHDSLFYRMFDKQDFAKSFNNIASDKVLLTKLEKGVVSSRKKFLYSYNRELFLKYIFGSEISS